VWHEGRLTLRSANAPDEPMSTRRSGFDTREMGRTRWRVFAAQGAKHDVQVYVGEQMASRRSILWAVLRSSFWPMAVSLPLLVLAVWWAVRQGIKPLHQLGGMLTSRAPLEPLQMDADKTPAEMVPLLSALNDLFSRIATLLQAERRFTADAAHELRTPIAGIRAQAQVALGARDEAERHHALEATQQGCDRASRLIDQMLTLSRLEASALPLHTTVDLAALTRRVVADLAPRALDKHQRLALEAPAPCPIQGDETLLGVLVRNVVDNAIRYSPRDAQVHVRVARLCDRANQGLGTVLTVEDSGAGLSDADRARLGERFFRVLGHAESGSGLGWSIVQRIAAVHGAVVHVDRSPALGGLQVMVCWTKGEYSRA
jgi:two-component system, OmpR family, sensor histidine kinase QseC